MAERVEAFVRDLNRRSRIAEQTDAANRQHYELPTEFFGLVLGPRLKYSCAYYVRGSRTSLAGAEEAMLQLYCERAELEDGQTVLDLGCGWGSLTLFLAERYPHMRIVALSNSKTQRLRIEEQLAERGVSIGRHGRVQVITADINDWPGLEEGSTPVTFDRIVSVEMFEHVKQYGMLMQRLSQWLKPHGRGKLFVHIFVHRSRRRDAQRSPAVAFSGASAAGAAVGRQRVALRADCRRLAAQSGRQHPTCATSAAGDVRRRGGAVGGVLAHVLYGLCRAVGFRRRQRVVRLALPLCGTVRKGCGYRATRREVKVKSRTGPVHPQIREAGASGGYTTAAA
eukprot:ctg_2078.g532